MLSQFLDDGLHEVIKLPDMQDWKQRFIRKNLGSLELATLPEKAGGDADVFLKEEVKRLPARKPNLFEHKKGKVYKKFAAAEAESPTLFQ